MKRLMNLSTHPKDLERFGEYPDALKAFMDRHELQGTEVIHYGPWDANSLPSSMIYGVHMSFWPIWLDFWINNQVELHAEFEDKETWVQYYGGDSQDALVSAYGSELKSAFEMGAEYCVFHVSHTSLKQCYTYGFLEENFHALSKTIIGCFAELINSVLGHLEGQIPHGFKILFENQWWPGLTLTSSDLAQFLLDQVQYPFTGFVLDTGHLMNTNLNLSSEADALAYMQETLEALGPLKDRILAIHLNSSLSGEYLKEALKNPSLYDETPRFFDRYFSAFSHIGKIDQHQVFKDSGINGFIQGINPEYLVLEFMTGTLDEAEQMIGEQIKVFNTR